MVHVKNGGIVSRQETGKNSSDKVSQVYNKMQWLFSLEKKMVTVTSSHECQLFFFHTY